MAENETPEATEAPESEAAPAAQTEAPAQQFSVQKIYLKDVSFESPSAPAVFSDQGQPELKMNLSQHVQSIAENVYEVVLTVTVTCKLAEKTAYLAEVQQAGIFGISGFEQGQLQAMLGAHCPSVLFPYARQQVSDLMMHGGFQPLLLQPVSFEQLYADQMRKRMAEAQAQQPAGDES
jgi:preprotein translocase subunit SecB